jgi:hypothetical protein
MISVRLAPAPHWSAPPAWAATNPFTPAMKPFTETEFNGMGGVANLHQHCADGRHQKNGRSNRRLARNEPKRSSAIIEHVIKQRGSIMPMVFDLLYREYCRARLAEMRKQLLIQPASDEVPEADASRPDNAKDVNACSSAGR